MIKNKKTKIGRGFAGMVQIMVMLISVFAFAYIIAGIPNVRAEEPLPAVVAQGCCPKLVDGSVCQNVNAFDTNLCTTDLIGSSCDDVEECVKGCCYDSIEGECSLNSPKAKCTADGGAWTNSAYCLVPQCQTGCCILGDQVSITTSKACAELSAEQNFDEKWTGLDPDGTCNSKIGVNERGACLIGSPDFAGKYKCKMSTKDQCKGDFKEGYLCTAPELNTLCTKTKTTTCVDGKEEVYFLDSCNNLANIYDADKVEDPAYWTKIVEKGDSCSVAGKDCGNCEVASGSLCSAYKSGRDTRATYGNNVCRTLDCSNGKKNGESWCVDDYKSTSLIGASPVGARSFIARCTEGTIEIEACADGNQQICISKPTGALSEARCVVNEWRSCLAANDKEEYEDIKKECEKSSQCIMFEDIPGNEKYKGLPGFKEVKNSKQGSVEDIGKDANSELAHCVPKYTPGQVFWSADNSGSRTLFKYGGSLAETQTLCSFGSFVCVSEYVKRGTSGFDWDIKENGECLTKAGDTALTWFEGLNERCKMLGPCGIKANIAGELGSNNYSETITQKKVESSGDVSKEGVENYILSENYTRGLINNAKIVKMGSIKSLASTITGLITGKASATDATVKEAKTSIKEYYKSKQSTGTMMAGALGSIGLLLVSNSAVFMAKGALSGTWGTPIGGVLAGAMIGAAAGYYIGLMIGKLFGMSPGETQALAYALMAAGAIIGGATGYAIVQNAAFCGGFYLICLAIAIIVAIIVYVVTFKDVQYYVTSYSCEPWEPPEKGDCSLCNKDVRDCSEYRCKSLGKNCHYFNDVGEPGYCTEISGIWSAKITPLASVLTEGLKYTNANNAGFSIEQNSEKQIEAWTPVAFGIETDKPANCKIDTKHTKSYDEKRYDFIAQESSCTSGRCDQTTKHKIALVPYMSGNVSAAASLPIKEGENTYYIQCMNFAGEVNEAEFIVKTSVKKGPDLTAPVIKRFAPLSGAYVKKDSNTTTVNVIVNEPAECRYTTDISKKYDEMEGKMACATNPDLGYFGEWGCSAEVKVARGTNKFYFACKDQPWFEEKSSTQRNVNQQNKEYILNVCASGLTISGVEPKNNVIAGKSPVSVELKAVTGGCVEGGKATCSYKFANYTGAFTTTNSNEHKQKFTMLGEGNYNITISCTDTAGNTAKTNAQFSIVLDNTKPAIIRSYEKNQLLNIITNENAECKFTQNKTIGCSFDYSIGNGTEVKSMLGADTVHTTEWKPEPTYFIKCSDSYGNSDGAECGVVLKSG